MPEGRPAPRASTIYTSSGKIIIGLEEPEDIRSRLGIGTKCCQCKGCYNTIFSICVYDESSSVYNWNNIEEEKNKRETQYLHDKTRWEGYVDNYRCNDIVHIRMGLLFPARSGTKEFLRWPGSDWPYDTTEDPIVIYDAAGSTEDVFWPPRISKEDIIAIFDEMLSTFPDEHPELLIFCLDNSGSIVVDGPYGYRAELDKAKEYFRETYPEMVLLDDISNTGERWIRDAAVGVANRLCKWRCLCPFCRGPRPEQINIYFPEDLPGMYPTYTMPGGTYILYPYGESTDTKCTWKNKNHRLRERYETVNEYGYAYTETRFIHTDIIATVEQGEYDEEREEYPYTYEVVWEINEGSSYQTYTWRYIMWDASDLLECDEVQTLELVDPQTEGKDITWNPGA
jgi:hypothetical protein